MPYTVLLPVQISETLVLENLRLFSPGHVYLNQSKQAFSLFEIFVTALTTRLRIPMGHPHGTFGFGISLRWSWRRCFPSTNRLDHHAAFGRNTDLNGASGSTIYIESTLLVPGSSTAFRIATLLPQSPSRYHPTITSFEARPEKDTTRLGTLIIWFLHYRDKLLDENMCCRVFISSFMFMTSPTLELRLSIYCLFIDPDWPLLFPQLSVFSLP